MGLRNFKDNLDYIEGRISPSDTQPWECSLFDLYPPMPGVMTKEEVERDLNLGSWELQLNGNIYTLNVSFSLNF